VKNRAKIITTAEWHTKETSHTSPKRASSRQHKRHRHTPLLGGKRLRLSHRRSSNQPTPQRPRSNMKICARTQPPMTRQRSPNSEEELRRRTRQGWYHGRSPNIPLVASHRTPSGTRHRSFNFTATSKPRKTHKHVGEEPTNTTRAMSSTSLDTTIVATEASTQKPSLPLVP
jgi:hypothetical protein